MPDIKTLIQRYAESVIDYRRHLHMHPELSHQEQETARFIAQTLRRIGLSPATGLGKNGVAALIEGAAPGRCIALRADIDALPIAETTGLPFASQNPGVCHACGHDMHAAMLLGAAHVLHALRSRFCGCVKLIFQPAEEDVSHCGALPMIRDGVLENPRVEAIVAGHIWPQYPVGQAGIRSGAMMAASDRFSIVVRGKASHGSAPEEGIDAIAAAGQMIGALQTIVSRSISPLDPAVVTVGTISGGDRYNIIAEEVSMEGTCRTLDSALRDRMPQHIEQIVAGLASAMGAGYRFEYLRGNPCVVNHPEIFRLVLDAIRESVGDGAQIPAHPALSGEDFAHFCERVPGAMFWLGVGDPKKEFVPLHNGGLQPDERALAVGVEILVRSALRFLGA